MERWIEATIKEKKEILDKLSVDGYFDKVCAAGKIMIDSLKKGNKILTAGNGGSASDAQHFTGEVVGHFLRDRKALCAVTLTVDPTVVTAISNDYGYDYMIARQIEGLGKKGDCVLLISTSGNSNNLVEAAQIARQKQIRVIGLLGKAGGKLANCCDLALIVSSSNTPRIQEIHTYTIHLLCEMIDKAFDEGAVQ